VASAAGQGSIFDSPAKPQVVTVTTPAADKGASKTVFTAEAVEKARATLRKKLGQMNSGFDPEILAAGITLAGGHIEAGARSFAAYSTAMIEDMSESIRPFLKSWYVAILFDPRATAFREGMTPIEQMPRTED
jgi:hypothetical protein